VNILLIQPAKAPLTIGGEDIYIYEPLALEYLAAGLENDHQVRILDMRLDSDLDATLAAFTPDVVGITAYTVHVNVARRLFEHVKAWNPAVLTVVGGHHATVAPDDFVSSHIDLVVRDPRSRLERVRPPGASSPSEPPRPGRPPLSGPSSCRSLSERLLLRVDEAAGFAAHLQGLPAPV
jgi:hypothetical protein